ncbi:MAG: hypothetical protein H6711_34485 [Myxococcales bacterium]|nr:hypothetical protein [Myxococcales bacterium]
MRSPRAALVLVAAALLGCAGGGEGPTTSGADTGSSGGGSDDPIPLILEPADDTVSIAADRRTPLKLRLAQVTPGVTQVLLDDRVLGSLSPGTSVGALSSDSLTISLRGAMLAGAHTLELLNPGGESDDPLKSRRLTLSVGSGSRPDYVATLGALTLDGALSLTLDGHGEDALLGVLLADDVLALFRRTGGGWSSPRSAAVPGHAAAPGAAEPALSAALVDVEGELRLRLAWRQGADGGSIAAVEVPWAGDEVGSPGPLAEVPAPFVGAFEWVAYGRPRFLGAESLVVEARALVDAEVAHPGDRRLLHVRWPAGGDPAAPATIDAAAHTDLDGVGRALDLLDPTRPLLAIREGGISPAWLEVVAGAPQVRRSADGSLGSPPDGEVGLTALASSLGSQIFFAVGGDGSVTATGIDALHEGDATAIPLGAPPPALAPSAGPSLGILVGIPFAAIPYGDAERVHLAVVDGTSLRLRPVEGLHCDMIAVAAEDPDASAAPIACLLGGELRLGELSAVEP